MRKNFPGGWPGDSLDKFKAQYRTEQENEAFNHIKALANFRKRAPAIASGKMQQYLPQEGLYVYFRYNDQQTIMVMMHTGTKPLKPNWTYYDARISGFKQIRNVISGELKPLENIEIQPMESFVFELVR